ncbi:MAG: hypothetical protein AAF806_29975, partial [Bacteroidota bacterium]
MKKSKSNLTVLITIALCLLTHSVLFACTIFSGKDSSGQVWTGNNEDWIPNFKNYLNVYPSEYDEAFGYITFSRDSPENGANSNAQGGMNEAGLFFDFNALVASGKTYVITNRASKKSFPKGDHKIFDHILSNFETVQEVIDFFDEYWFDYGFNTAQMHVADKYGNFGIINATGSRLLTEAPFQVSTNFSICDKEDSDSCWRFPIVTEILTNEGTSLNSFTKACKNTAQEGWTTTSYSNIQNLNTGEIILYYALDYEHPYKTSVKELLAKGQRSYLMMDLFKDHSLSQVHNTFRAKGGDAALQKLASLNLEADEEKNVLNNLVLPLVLAENNLDALPLVEAFLAHNPEGYIFRLHQALTYFYNGDVMTAKSIVEQYKKDIPDTSLDTERIINMMNGQYEDDANFKVELDGYTDAKSVMVKGLSGSPQLFFLNRKPNGWFGQFKLPKGIYNYSFIVDGKELLDEQMPVHSIQSIFQTTLTVKHRVCIGFTEERYQKTITVKVPNKTDEVYIAGNQSAMTHWNSVIRLERVSDFERAIS